MTVMFFPLSKDSAYVFLPFGTSFKEANENYSSKYLSTYLIILFFISLSRKFRGIIDKADKAM